MKQIIIKKGSAITEDVSRPTIEDGFILIKTSYSCISAGTEIASVQNSKKSLVNRAMEKPEKINQALNMIRKQGLIGATKQIKDLTSAGQGTGYSISGIVIETGADIENIKQGDKVAAAGGGYAVHAGFVLVPKNLVVKIPKGVSLEDASSATIGSIAMHGVRRANLALGEYAAVIGCGIIGLFTIQLLKASGVKVAALDFDNRRLEIAKEVNADIVINPADKDVVQTIRQWSHGMGVDAVLFTAAVNSKEPLSQAFNMCRKKGAVVLVGTAPIEINRADIFADEIDFRISTSYGPGRYDKNYEEKGHDYPYAYVRWTEQRNIAEFLNLINNKSVNVEIITDKIYPVEKAQDAFESLSTSKDKPLIVLIKYSDREEEKTTTVFHSNNTKLEGKIKVAVVGVGSFFKNVHLPNLQLLKDKFSIYAVMSRKGYDAKIIAEQNGAKYSTTDYEQILSDKEVDLVFISTRHESHGSLILQALKAGKNVFVEKPLTISLDEFEEIKQFFKENTNPPLLMVGYNRRFSKITSEIKKTVTNRLNPLFIRYRMNAGHLPKDHWVLSEGGRIIGEACHIIDLMQSIVNAPVIELTSSELTPSTNYYSNEDNKSFTLKFEDGSIASIDYFSCGNSNLSKEFMEIHFDGNSIVMNDFKSLTGYGVKLKEFNLSTSDKGHLEELEALYNALKNNNTQFPISLNDLFSNSWVTFNV